MLSILYNVHFTEDFTWETGVDLSIVDLSAKSINNSKVLSVLGHALLVVWPMAVKVFCFVLFFYLNHEQFSHTELMGLIFLTWMKQSLCFQTCIGEAYNIIINTVECLPFKMRYLAYNVGPAIISITRVQIGFSFSGQGDIILIEDLKLKGSLKWEFQN